ncbi:MAG: hypothetical protein JWO74_3139 [Solirubrobacterales bacterium]|jgi:hypothetical protein|nr:hypothetical protein [Solirubrobacterales bacterium]
MFDLDVVNRASARRVVNAIVRLPVPQRRMALRAMAQSDSPTLQGLAKALAVAPRHIGVASEGADTSVERVARVIGVAGLSNEGYTLVDSLGNEDPWRAIREALRVALDALLAEDDRDSGGGMRMVLAAGTSFDRVLEETFS